MWEFRRNPRELSKEEKQKLEGLFRQLPRLRALCEIRVRFQKIFDSARGRGRGRTRRRRQSEILLRRPGWIIGSRVYRAIAGECRSVGRVSAARAPGCPAGPA